MASTRAVTNERTVEAAAALATMGKEPGIPVEAAQAAIRKTADLLSRDRDAILVPSLKARVDQLKGELDAQRLKVEAAVEEVVNVAKYLENEATEIAALETRLEKLKADHHLAKGDYQKILQQKNADQTRCTETEKMLKRTEEHLALLTQRVQEPEEPAPEPSQQPSLERGKRVHATSDRNGKVPRRK